MHATYFCLYKLFVITFVGQVADTKLKSVNRAVLWQFDLKSFFLCLFAFSFLYSNAKAKVGKRKAKKPYWQCNNLKQNFIDEDMCSERSFAIMLISYRKWTTWFSVLSTLYFHKTKNMTSNGIFLLCYMILVTHVLKTTNRHGRNIKLNKATCKL